MRITSSVLSALDRRLATRTANRVTNERRAVRAGRQRRVSMRRLWSADDLPMPRTFMRGPRWKSAFGVTEVPIADVSPLAAPDHRPGRKLWMFTLEADVRERICEVLRPDVYAMWSDPREGWN